jgi:hypothetical protein
VIVWRTEAREAIVSNVNGGGAQVACRLCKRMEAYTVLRGWGLSKKESKERNVGVDVGVGEREEREERRGEERGERISYGLRRCDGMTRCSTTQDRGAWTAATVMFRNRQL